MTTVKKKSPTLESSVTMIGGGPANIKVVRSQAAEYEDAFEGKYGLGKLHAGVQVLQPPYNIKQLMGLCHNNNTLGPCIQAMVTNVHGTGYSIEPEEEMEGSDTEDTRIKEIEAFFTEPYPGLSWTTVRKKIGNHVEKTGVGYLEIIKNLEGQMVFARPVDPKLMRLVELGDPVEVPMEVTRAGTTFTAIVARRFRRFVQLLGQKKIFFKEYGCPHHLNKKTGEWETKENPIKPEDRSSDIVYFTKEEDSETPYGVPAWVAQIPSVLGSRKAEEQNLGYFDNGGVPPMIIFVQGGKMAEQAKKDLNKYMKGNPGDKHEVPVVEIWGGGSTDGKSNRVDVKIERFGSERQNDSMFEQYDEKCEMRIRRSWRLPSIFTGNVATYTFATAYASYTVAEAQIFKPEREEFDEIINNTIMVELSADGYVYRSKALTVNDIQHQLRALELAWKTGAIDAAQFIEILNDLCNVGLTPQSVVTEPAIPPVTEGGEAQPAINQTPTPSVPQPTQSPSAQKTGDSISDMVDGYLAFLGDDNLSGADEALKALDTLGPEAAENFNTLLAERATELLDEPV